MAKYGYARVSSLSQSTDIQVEALTKAGLSASIIGKALFENKITLAEALAGDPAC